MELESQWRAQSSLILRNGEEPKANPSFGAAAHSVEKIYDDIKATLRVSVISLPFSLWSRQPALLELLWGRLKPNLATRYVESAADRIRERAVRTISTRFRLRELKRLEEESDLPGLTIQMSRFLVDIHHYANPKLLIATAGLLEALQGHSFEPVKDHGLRMSVPQGIPAAMPKVAIRQEPFGQPDSALLQEIQEILALPAVSSDYLYLGSLGGYLDRVWVELKRIIRTETFWQLAEDLESLAAVLARGLPYPMAIGREAFKSMGLTVSEARNRIIPSHLALTRLILSMAALKVALDGKDGALQSPYPISAGC